MRIPVLFVRAPFIVPYWANGETSAAIRALVAPRNDREAVARSFRERLQTPRAVAVSSGRFALELALGAAGVRAGDEVVLPSFGCAALVAAVHAAGALPVFADVTADFVLDPDSFATAMGPRVKAVVVVHAGGKRAAVEEIADAARPRGIAVIEDCAQATGASSQGRFWGTAGDLAIFSFGVGKNAMATAGGLVTGIEVDDRLPVSSRLDDAWRLLEVVVRHRLARVTRPFMIGMDLARRRSAPEDRDGGYVRQSLSRMDAAIVRRQLEIIDRIIEIRTRNAQALISALAGHEGLILPRAEDHVFTKFYVALRAGAPRNGSRAPEVARLIQRLLRAGFEPELSYLPLHRRYANQGRAVGCARTEDLAYRTLTLPVRPGLTARDMARMAEVILSSVPS